jgi:protein SCO1/2
MPAMTMEFVVAAGDLALAKPGQRIRAELVAPKEGGDFRLEKIWPNDKVNDDTIAASALQLRQDTHTRGKNAYREIGETVPDFALYDQSGGVVQSSRFRGKQIMLNFIFTRCPDAKMCPAATAKMMSTQQLARETGVPDLEFVSITLDPAYDTPGVLKEYADLRGIDTSNFSLLTGPENAIRDLLTQFGVIAQFQGDILQHTLTTLLIDAKGKIAHRTDGSMWDPKDFVAKMKKS